MEGRAGRAERDLWQGLAQLAVGLTHALRGNARGAVTLLRRGGARLAGYAGTSPHGIDVDGSPRRRPPGWPGRSRRRPGGLPAGRLRVSLTR